MTLPRAVFWRRRVVEKVISLAGRSDMRILDLGASSGSFAVSALPWPVRLVTIDRKVSGELCIIGDARALALKSGSVDFLVATELLEHVAESGLVCSEARRVLTRDGIAVFSTPWLWEILYEPEIPVINSIVPHGRPNLKAGPQSLQGRLAHSIQSGDMHINWHAPWFWRRVLKSVFHKVQTVGFCLGGRPTDELRHIYLTAGFVMFFCSITGTLDSEILRQAISHSVAVSQMSY